MLKLLRAFRQTSMVTVMSIFAAFSCERALQRCSYAVNDPTVSSV
jgi:hypothetical protein